jgi:hypothetical protein
LTLRLQARLAGASAAARAAALAYGGAIRRFTHSLTAGNDPETARAIEKAAADFKQEPKKLMALRRR